nr:nitroreductase [Maliibacterium massiliense]
MTNDVLQALKKRRSIRAFKPEQITNEELAAVLEAGTYAATGSGKQSPIIIAVQDPQAIAQLTRMNAAVLGKDTDPYYGAPTIALVLADRSRSTAVEDASCVMQNMMVAAYALGLGSCWINREREMFDTPEGKALLKSWGVAGDYVGVGACILGYPACDLPEPAPRKPDYIRIIK